MLPCGLDSVTVAPGSTAPDESVTVPPTAPTPCANTGGVAHAHNANATTIVTKRGAVIVIPFVNAVPLVGSIRARAYTCGVRLEADSLWLTAQTGLTVHTCFGTTRKLQHPARVGVLSSGAACWIFEQEEELMSIRRLIVSASVFGLACVALVAGGGQAASQTPAAGAGGQRGGGGGRADA